MTMTMEDYRARVPNIDDREESARLFEVMRAAEAATREAQTAQWQAQSSCEHAYELGALRATFEAKRDELQAWFDGEKSRILGTVNLGEAEAAEEAATQAYEDAPGGAIIEGEDDAPLRCALSGAPVWEDDQTVEIHGKTILACVLLSPEQIAALAVGSEDEADEDDTDDEIEDAA